MLSYPNLRNFVMTLKNSTKREIHNKAIKMRILKTIFRCMSETSGVPAQYIPQLARGDPTKWGVSLCTIDGQRFSIGDTKDNFSLQSTR